MRKYNTYLDGMLEDLRLLAIKAGANKEKLNALSFEELFKIERECLGFSSRDEEVEMFIELCKERYP